MQFHNCNEKTIVKPQKEKDTMMKWNTQVGNILSNKKAKVNFFLPEFSVTKIVTWEFHADYSD